MIIGDMCGLFKSKLEIIIIGNYNHVKNSITSIQTQHHITLKFIRSDNGPGFLLISFYDSLGIIDHKFCVETPQNNGGVDKKH